MDGQRKNTLRSKRVPVVIGVAIAVIAGGIAFARWFSPNGTDTSDPSRIPLEIDTSEPTGTPGQFGIDVQLSDGQSQPQDVTPLPLATGEPLSLDDISMIFARLPALIADSADQTDFHFPAEILPPPRPGNTIKESFPPQETGPAPAEDEAGPLHVLRFAPEGEVPIAPVVSVTFDQAMVPLGTLGDLAAKDVPVIMEPSLPGTWRWLGTKTLTFEYESDLIDRLPKATVYTLTVPSGTKSVTGGVLAEAVSWKFTTPPPKVITTYPDASPQPLEPLFFVAFDQRIDPAAVLKTITVNTNSETVSLVLASAAEIEKDTRVSQFVKDTQEGRWLAFRAVNAFEPETNVSVTIGPGTPSAEGPLTTTEAQTFGFTTYTPLRIAEHRCGWDENNCPPLTPFYIRFNNPLDTNVTTEDMLQVEPKIEGVTADIMGDTIVIGGLTQGRTTYTVTVSGKVQDIFGQQLDKDVELTFKVGKAEARLINPEQAFVTLDPTASKKLYSAYVVNYDKLNLKVFAVEPNDWLAFRQKLMNDRWTDTIYNMPGSLVEDSTLKVDLPPDTLSEVTIDLGGYMKGKSGQFILILEPPAGKLETNDQQWSRWQNRIITWVQVTQIGLDAYTDSSQMVVWATDLRDGSPLQGIRIQPDNSSSSFLTAKDGLLRIKIPEDASYLLASKGSDQAFLPRSFSVYDDGKWSSRPVRDSLQWYVFDDRQMYRPGEEVHVKGWVRQVGGGQTGDVGLATGLRSLQYQVMDSLGNNFANGTAEANAFGAFDLAFTIPETINLGYANITLQAQGDFGDLDQAPYYYHSFQIQQFRRPEYEVSARNETSAPYFVNDSATLAVEAKYYAGGGLPNADVTWQVTTSPGEYTPPNWSDFTFGNWHPWWFYDVGYPGPYGGGQTETFTGKTDASGTHYLKLDLKATGDPAKDPQPQSVVAEATVMDVNRQAWSSTTTLLVHPADVYIGIRSDRYFVPRGTPLKVDFIVTDLDGNPVADRPVKITAGRLEWKMMNGNWTEELVDVQTCSLLSTPEPDSCSFETSLGGSYQITALVTDELGRKNQSRFTRWVSGGEQPASRKIEQDKVTLIPDKETYKPGDTAEILVQSPFTPAEGLLTVSRSGMLYTTRFQIKDGSTTLRIPIEAEYIPNIQVQVDLVGAAPRTNEKGEVLKDIPARPAYATGALDLSIPPVERTLSVQVAPAQDKLEPGGETTLTVKVKDANNLPVSDAEVAVVVVDEAILALTNYQMADPMSVFYTERWSDVYALYGRSSIILASPEAFVTNGLRDRSGLANTFSALPTASPAATEAPAMAEALDGAKSAQPDQPIAIRSDFNPLATFAPSVRTGVNGEVRISIKLPDNLTRYRVMVVAVDESGKEFGTGESNITARLPLMVRPSAPRFLNFGDQFELPVVVQNQTDFAMTVDVVVRATNLGLDKAGFRVTVPANDRVEVRFPATTISAGTVHLQVAATSGQYADAATIELPVYTPATTESFATYGVIDDGSVAQPVQYPSDVFPQYGGLEITTSSTALQALTDAVLYLTSCPYEGSEQMASRILAIASLRDVLSAFKAEGLPSAGEMESAVQGDIDRLKSLQNDDGGFSYWQRGLESVPFNTIHVAHALIRAREKGFNVPDEMPQNALTYLRDIESHYPSWYSQDTRWSLSAYALYVRDLSGDRDSNKAERLLKEAGLDSLSMESIGWLWHVIDDPSQLDAIRLYVNNHVVETAGAANFTTAYSDQTYLLLSSDRRTDAILLDALMKDNPQSDLIVKVVNGLLAHRTKGRWGNTQENVFVLLALDRYFNTYETQTPDFVARIWLGETYAGSNEFRGRTTDQYETVVPMTYVLSETAAGGGMQDLILSKDGPGRLYYRLGLQYAPTDLNLDPLDMGFVVQRSYEGLDNSEDVYQDKDGTWHIKAGARVRVKLTMVADNRRYHVALVDPLPAGLEIVNPSLAVSQSVPPDPTNPQYRYLWWWGPWYEHQNMRDDRAEAFTSMLWDGVYEYTYVARATTPGTYVVPPAKAEEMYSPEVFGRSGSDRVIVK